MKKRLFSMFLVLAMVFTMLPLSALAEENGTEAVTDPETAEVCPEAEAEPVPAVPAEAEAPEAPVPVLPEETEPEEPEAAPTAEESPEAEQSESPDTEQAEAEPDSEEELSVSLMAIPTSGKLGTKLTWELDGANLIISGSGPMPDFSSPEDAPWYSFRNRISRIWIKDGVTTVGRYAFYDCNRAADAIFPKSLTYIGDYAFYQCSILEIKSQLFINFTTIYSYLSNITHVGNYAFYSCVFLTFDFTSLRTIGNYAFSLCYIPNTVVFQQKDLTIGTRAFSECRNVEEVIFEHENINISSNAFYHCDSLSILFFKSTASVIQSTAFDECSSLKHVFISANKATWNASLSAYGSNYNFPEATKHFQVLDGGICNSTFWKISNSTLTVFGNGWAGIDPNKYKEVDYKYLYRYEPWYAYRETIQHLVIEEGIIGIENSAFSFLVNMTSASLPHTLYQPIGLYAFYNCSSLVSINLPSSMTDHGNTIIYNWCFSGCQSLTSIVIPEGITDIQSYAFEGCTSLTSVTLPSSLKIIHQFSFAGCAFSSIEIPNNVDRIDFNAFAACKNLSSIAIPAGITELGSATFGNCTSLTSVWFLRDGDLDPMITKIGPAFCNCPLTDVYYGADEARWDTNITIFNYENGAQNEILGATFHFNYYGGGPLSDTAAWDLNSNGVLSVFGSGNMPYYSTPEEAPWYIIRSYIKEVRVSGVTSTGANTFSGCKNLIFAMLSDGVTYTGHHAFSQCTALTAVFVPADFDTVGVSSFEGCSSLKHVFYAGPSADWNVFVNSGNTPFSDAERNNRVIAAGPCGDSAVWYISPNSSSSTLLISGTGRTWDYTGSDTPWYSYRSTLSIVAIEKGITEIGNWSFYNLTSLTFISFSSSVTAIGDFAFYICSQLPSVKIPESVTRIGNDAFAQCNKLSSVTIPDSVTSIGQYAFFYCSALEEIAIPGGITSIEAGTFRSCSKLVKAYLPASLIRIDKNAFNGCSSLKYLFYPDSDSAWSSIYIAEGNGPLTSSTLFPNSLGGGSFGSGFIWLLMTDNKFYIFGTGAMPDYSSFTDQPWYSLRSQIHTVEIENGITSIGNNAFSICRNLTSVTIPEGVTRIGTYAFQQARISQITIPSGVTTIDTGAFNSCEKLKEIYLPQTLRTIGSSAFYNCPSLSSVTFDGGRAAFNAAVSGTSGNDSLLSATLHCWLDAGSCGNNLQYTLTDDGVLTISGSGDMWDFQGGTGPNWWNYCHDVMSIIIENGVTSISSFAFDGCDNAEYVFIPSSVKSIDEFAFNCCRSLLDVVIPSSVTYVDSYAFDNCTSDTRIYGASGSAAETFANKHGFTFYPGGSCGGNVNWMLNGTKMTIFGKGNMNNFSYSASSDSALTPWEKNIGSIQSAVIQSGVTSIGDAAFYRCTRLSSVTIPNSVTSIGSRAFSKSAISSVFITDGVTAIGTLAFANCSSLSTVWIPATLTSIGSNAFDACSALSSITVSSLNQNYSSYEGLLYNKAQTALICCPNGKTGSAVLSPKLTAIGEAAFCNCPKITNMTIPDGITAIPSAAFQNCTRLTVITIPSSVTDIGSSAFSGCTGLTDVCFTGSQSKWNSIHIDDSSDGNLSLHNARIHYNCIGGGLCSSSVTWALDSSGVLTVSGTGNIPAYTDIATAPWRSLRDNIKKVVISDGITGIGQLTFACCPQLTSVTFPSTLTTINDKAFYYSDLRSAVISKSVTDIGSDAFYGNKNLDFISVSADNPSYSSYNGMLCNKNQTNVIFIPNGKTGMCYIPYGATSVSMNGANGLTALLLPASIKSITTINWTSSKLTDIYFVGTEDEWNAVTVSPSLNSTVTLHCNTYAIGSCGEFASWSLKSDGVLTISGTGKLYDYNQSNSASWKLYSFYITEIKVLNGITEIGNYAFDSLSQATSVSLPSSLTRIGESAFLNCEKLISVNIPANVTQIDNYAFDGCNSLQSINADANNKTYSSESGVLYNKAKIILVLVPTGISSLFSIPSSVTSIEANAARACRKLTSISIPAGMKTIGDSAFCYCTALKNVFYFGTSSEWNKINIRSNNSFLTNATIYHNILGAGACGDTAFWVVTNDDLLAVFGTGEINSYEAAANVPWYSFHDVITEIIIDEGITAIGRTAFSALSKVANIPLPASLTNIGESAFRDCESLLSVNIPENVAQIGDYAFDNCSSLQSINVDANNAAFSSESGVLYNKAKTTLLLAPNGIISLHSIPSSVTSIAEKAFEACNSLTSVTIPAGVKTIGNSAFCYCAALEDVYFAGTSSEWNSISIGTSNACLTDAAVYCLFDCDVNADGNLDLKDVSLQFRWWNGKDIDAAAAANVPHCDLNKDLTVDLRDIALLYNLLATLGPQTGHPA